MYEDDRAVLEGTEHLLEETSDETERPLTGHHSECYSIAHLEAFSKKGMWGCMTVMGTKMHAT